ncbi:MAG TPA: hypothetical protein VF334_00895, partial [Polyangia bacterium]
RSDADWIDAAINHEWCWHDVLDPSIIECDESAFILDNATVRVGNFAGTMRLLDPIVDGKPSDTERQLFVGVRGDPSITEIKVHLHGDGNDNMLGVSPPTLDCFEGNTPPMSTLNPPVPPTCAATALVQDYYCNGEPACTVGVNGNGKTQLPTEPFGMVIDSSPFIVNDDGVKVPKPRLVVSHLATGQVSVIDISPGSQPDQSLLSESTAFFPADANGRHGAFGIAQQDPSDPHSLWYLTSSVNPLMATFRIADANVVVVAPQSTFALSNTFSQGTDVRDIVFDTGGQRAFVTENNPPSVMLLDTRVDPTSGNQPRNIITNVIDVCQEPSHFGVRRLSVAGAPGTPPYTKTKLIVVCFGSSQVMIVDPDRPGVDGTVFSGIVGPNDITFNFSDEGSVQPIADVGLGRHAYVTNYSESTIAILDLEPGSPTENRVIGKLGLPTDGFNP